jgi:hypothetical protein
MTNAGEPTDFSLGYGIRTASGSFSTLRMLTIRFEQVSSNPEWAIDGLLEQGKGQARQAVSSTPTSPHALMRVPEVGAGEPQQGLLVTAVT